MKGQLNRSRAKKKVFGKVPAITVKMLEDTSFKGDLKRRYYQMGFKEGQEEYRQFILNVLAGIDIADKEMTDEISLCPSCRCITHDIPTLSCGKCNAPKFDLEKIGGTKAIRLAINSRVI